MKAYLRYVPTTTFGVVASSAQCTDVLLDAKGKRAVTACLEEACVFDLRQGAKVRARSSCDGSERSRACIGGLALTHAPPFLATGADDARPGPHARRPRGGRVTRGGGDRAGTVSRWSDAGGGVCFRYVRCYALNGLVVRGLGRAKPMHRTVPTNTHLGSHIHIEPPKKGAINLFEAGSGALKVTLHGHRAAVAALCFARSGTRLVHLRHATHASG